MKITIEINTEGAAFEDHWGGPYGEVQRILLAWAEDFPVVPNLILRDYNDNRVGRVVVQFRAYDKDAVLADALNGRR